MHDGDSRDLVTDDRGVTRCWWGARDADSQRYHDTEWGSPVADDTRLFEKLSLEGFQAGLSWLTILRRREGFRRAFARFDIPVVAAFDAHDVDRLMQDEGIIRHRGKIEATIGNARVALALIESFGSLAASLWRFAPARAAPAPADRSSIPTQTAESVALSRDLKRRGWRFLGPTTAYAFMQAMGLVNDHLAGCTARRQVQEARASFKPPSCHGPQTGTDSCPT